MKRPDKRTRATGRRTKHTFVALPHHLLDHPAYRSLSHSGARLLIDLARQYNGYNNGSLSATWTLLKDRGWRSKDTLHRALEELLSSRLVVRTRRGGLRPLRHSMYALAWWDLDAVDGMDSDWDPMIGKRIGAYAQKSNGTDFVS